MDKINNANDLFFKRVVKDENNARALLKRILPESLKKNIDFSRLSIETTDHVSNQFKEGRSDVILKTVLKDPEDPGQKERDTDIYIVIEHKSYRDEGIFVQLLTYMSMMWQNDFGMKKPLRVIIPLVFYHGKEAWNMPHSFVDQFDVNDEVKEFLLNFRYVLFDTVNWNFREEKNREMRENVFLLTAISFMKSAYDKNIESVREIFKFWREKGFTGTGNDEEIVFFLLYFSETHNIEPDKLKTMLEESKIEGGNIMNTLAKLFRDEGIEVGIKEGIEIGIKEGKLEGKFEAIERMMRKGFDISTIEEIVDISREQIEKYAKEFNEKKKIEG
jgi:predicted transposase/invertase (TIGR01784 family)